MAEYIVELRETSPLKSVSKTQWNELWITFKSNSEVEFVMFQLSDLEKIGLSSKQVNLESKLFPLNDVLDANLLLNSV